MEIDVLEPQLDESRNGGVAGRVVLVERLGGTTHIHFDAGSNRMLASVTNERLPAVGDAISVRMNIERAHLFVDDQRVTAAS
jgi:ABC-type sugar transport systems, ATPase components